MKLILLQDVKGHGKKGAVVQASDGYARNFLIPKNLAVEANQKNMDELDRKKVAEERKRIAEIEEAMALAEKLKQLNIAVKVKAGENGKLFGAVTNKEIAQAVLEQAGIEIDRKKIDLHEPIKHIGSEEVEVKLHAAVTAKLTVSISAL